MVSLEALHTSKDDLTSNTVIVYMPVAGSVLNHLLKRFLPLGLGCFIILDHADLIPDGRP